MRFTTALCMLLILLSTTDAQIPPLMHYQGQITSETSLNNPVEIHFAIYAQATSGQPLWTETRAITHTNGSFSVLLGSLSPFPQNLFSAENRYLELRVGTDSAFRPRQRIVSAAYAFQAQNAVGHLTPQSITVSNTVIDSTGKIAASHIQTDSLSVGGIGIINRQGQWTGPSMSEAITALDTIIVKSVQNPLSFGSATWLDIDGTTDVLTAFVNFKTTGFLDTSFDATISANGSSFETRIVIAPINPAGDPITNISNVSRFIPQASGDEGILSNQVALRVEPGLYKVFIQGQITGIGTLTSANLIIRAFSR